MPRDQEANDLLAVVHGELITSLNLGETDPFRLLALAIVAHAYETGGLKNEASEIDRTLIGSFDDLIANSRDLTKAIDRLLGAVGK